LRDRQHAEAALLQDAAAAAGSSAESAAMLLVSAILAPLAFIAILLIIDIIFITPLTLIILFHAIADTLLTLSLRHITFIDNTFSLDAFLLFCPMRCCHFH